MDGIDKLRLSRGKLSERQFLVFLRFYVLLMVAGCIAAASVNSLSLKLLFLAPFLLFGLFHFSPTILAWARSLVARERSREASHG